VFVALGGASFAAFALPANSVGTRELKFPLGLMSGPRRGVVKLPVAPSCIEACPFTTTSHLASVQVSLKRRTSLLVLVSAWVDPHEVRPSTIVGFGPAVNGSSNLDAYKPSESVTLKGWDLMSLSAGRHTINLVADASARRQGFLYVYDAQVSVVAVPHLQ
jgi:hypothetical protein